MIKSVKIENYKSIQELEVDVGRFNVIIGENGAGKSNFLEALALFGAAEADKLDNEFLVSRGVRVCSPKNMLSVFNGINNDAINLRFRQYNTTNSTHLYTLKLSNTMYPKFEKGDIQYPSIDKTDMFILQSPLADRLEKIEQEISELHNIDQESSFEKEKYFLMSAAQKLKEKLNTTSSDNTLRTQEALLFKKNMTNFLLYSPENTALRNFYREGQIEPLGINGEGLLKLLKVMQESEPAAFQDVLTCLELFDWFETIDVPKDLSSMEDKVSIRDKYLTTLFDQRSANEGFLFVLFYAALFCSQYTPKIFAIDNIDASFNPKLCTVLIKKLVELTKKYDKQVFVTTHNPAILDGVDLGDEEQKLFVASRNKQGHTRFKTLTLADKPKSSTGEPIRLSEAFLRGYLGGLPKNF